LFEPPCVMNIKGKGEMVSYRLVSRADMQDISGKTNIYQLPPKDSAPATA